jgi:hypothetical protein
MMMKKQRMVLMALLGYFLFSVTNIGLAAVPIHQHLFNSISTNDGIPKPSLTINGFVSMLSDAWISHRVKKIRNRMTSDSLRLDKTERKAVWSMSLGISSLCILFIPALNLLSLPMAILAIIFGASVIKKIKVKKKAQIGIIFGSITTVLILATLAIVAIILGSGRVK